MESVPSLKDRHLPAGTTSNFLAAAKTLAIAHDRPSVGDGSAALPLWLWWNILSADAPAVAAAWALLFAGTENVLVSGATIGLLALAVWLIYVFDRLLDGWRADDASLRTRHKFSAQHRTFLTGMLMLGTVVGIWLVHNALTATEIKSGLVLSVIVVIYLFCVHLGGELVARWFPKEIAVGFVFAAGTLLPVWSQVHEFSIRLWLSSLLLALLCALNCVAIECWENRGSEDEPASQAAEVKGRSPGHDAERPLRIAPGALSPSAHSLSFSAPASIVKLTDSWIAELAAILATGALATAVIFPVAGLLCAALAAAALLMLLVDASRRRLSIHALRVLADFALVAPALLALVIRR